MSAIITNKFRMQNAAAFLEAFTEAAPSNMYLFIGRPQAWDDENIPDTPFDTVQGPFAYWNDMTALKRVTSSDVKYAAPRNNWTSGTVYDQYEHDISTSNPASSGATNLYDSEFFVMSANYNVYKCISNNDGAQSTIEPSGTSTSIITTSDGYKWKYMFTINPGDIIKFLTADFIPVTTDSTVAAAAVDGAINNILIVAGGSGYSQNTSIIINGDGTGATANAVVTSNVLTGITITNPGSGYRFATITVSDVDGSLAEAKAIISPIGGHGSDAPKELGASYVMLNTRLEYADGSGDFPISNDFRRIGIVMDPLDFGSSNVATSTTLNANYGLRANNYSAAFSVDEIITGSTSGAKALVVATETANANAVIRFIQTDSGDVNFDSFTIGETIIGGSSGTTAVVRELYNPEVEHNTGEVVYVENRKAISRASDQVESIHLVVEF